MDPGFTAYVTGLKEGRQYSPKEMEEARDRLLALGVFSSVTVREGDATRRQRPDPDRGPGQRTQAALLWRRRHAIEHGGAGRRRLLGPPQPVRSRRDAAHRRVDRAHRRRGCRGCRQAQLQCRDPVREAGRDRAGFEVLLAVPHRLRTSGRLRPLLDRDRGRPRPTSSPGNRALRSRPRWNTKMSPTSSIPTVSAIL